MSIQTKYWCCIKNNETDISKFLNVIWLRLFKSESIHIPVLGEGVILHIYLYDSKNKTFSHSAVKSVLSKKQSHSIRDVIYLQMSCREENYWFMISL